MTIKEFQDWFNVRYAELLEETCDELGMAGRDEAVRSLLAYLSSMTEHGKRFRPYLTHVGYVTEGGEEDIFLLYAAVELLHLFCLIHDDAIDGAADRHALPTIERHIEEVYDDETVGHAVAILAGDLVLSWAYECLDAMNLVEPYTIDEAGDIFRAAVSDVILGQLLDVLSAVAIDQTKESIEKKIELKSARYSFFHPLYMGMALAVADESKELFAEEYAISLGMAFQIEDDIRDWSQDVRAGVQTHLTWYMRNLAPSAAQEAFETYIGLEWSEDEERKLERILEDSGAFAWAMQKAEEYYLLSEDAIFNHGKTGEEIWQELIDAVRNMP